MSDRGIMMRTPAEQDLSEAYDAPEAEEFASAPATTGEAAYGFPANVASLPSADRREKLRILEAILFAASEPLDEVALAGYLKTGDDVGALLSELQGFYASRGIVLVEIGGKWAFRTAGDLAYLLEKHTTEERKLSRAALETLAIIAYHQPVTRAEIEEIRGVVTSKGTLDALMETGWVRPRGRRRAPGKPVTYGTTDAFLQHFGLPTLKDLPGLAELKGLGLLDGNLPPDFRVPEPTDVAALMPDELPLDAADDEEEASADDEAAEDPIEGADGDAPEASDLPDDDEASRA
jgi:segregation and condensation protein B